MGLRTSIVVLVVGLIGALAVTLQVQRVDLSAAGWCLVIGALAGLLISGVQRVRRQPYAEWFAIGPWLLIIGLVATQAVDLPQVTGVDLWMVGLIVLVIGVVVTLAAIYVVSPLRVSKTMKSAWGADGSQQVVTPPDRQAYLPPALPPSYDDRVEFRGRQGPAYDTDSTRTMPPGERASGYDDRTEYQRPSYEQPKDGGDPPTQQLPRS